MSGEAMAWAKRCSGAGSVAQLVLMLLADWADHENKAWPGIRTLAGMTGRSERTIIRAVKRLEEEGLIEKSARSAWCSMDNPVCRAKGPHKHRTSNVYRLNVGQVARSQQPAPAAPGAGVGVPNSDSLSLMEETAESSGSSNSDSLSLMGSNSDIPGSPLATPVSPVCNSDTPEIYPPDRTRPGGGDLGARDGSGGPVRSGREEPGLSSYGSDRAAPGAARRAGTTLTAPVSAPSVSGLSGDDRLLLGECLPERMRALDACGAVRVVALLRERLAAGWRPADIRAVMDQDLPQRVGRLSSLVAARLERNVDPSLAPTSSSGGAVSAARARAEEDARWEARRRRSEDLAGGADQRPNGGEEDLMVRAMARVRSESPGVGRAEQARLAAELVRSWQVEGVAS